MECDHGVQVPPPLHSKSSQVHVKGQADMKLVPKPLGKAGVREQSCLVAGAARGSYWSLKGAQRTARSMALTFLLQRAPQAVSCKFMAVSSTAVQGGQGGSCTFTVASSGSVPPLSRCQLSPFLTFHPRFTVAFFSL